MIMPASGIINFGRLVGELGAGIGDVFLIALPTCLSSMRRQNEAEGSLYAVLVHLLQRVDQERLAVAQTDVNRPCAAALRHKIPQCGGLTECNLIERRLAADGFVVMG